MGFSFLQGPHQAAQKSSKTTFPFVSDNQIVSPLIDLPDISGALFPGLIPIFCCEKENGEAITINMIIITDLLIK